MKRIKKTGQEDRPPDHRTVPLILRLNILNVSIKDNRLDANAISRYHEQRGSETNHTDGANNKEYHLSNSIQHSKSPFFTTMMAMEYQFVTPKETN